MNPVFKGSLPLKIACLVFACNFTLNNLPPEKLVFAMKTFTVISWPECELCEELFKKYAFYMMEFV